MRKNMKKAVALTMAAVTAMSLTACGGTNASSSNTPATHDIIFNS